MWRPQGKSSSLVFSRCFPACWVPNSTWTGEVITGLGEGKQVLKGGRVGPEAWDLQAVLGARPWLGLGPLPPHTSQSRLGFLMTWINEFGKCIKGTTKQFRAPALHPGMGVLPGAEAPRCKAVLCSPVSWQPQPGGQEGGRSSTRASGTRRASRRAAGDGETVALLPPPSLSASSTTCTPAVVVVSTL